MKVSFYTDLASALEPSTPKTSHPTISPIEVEAARRITSFRMSHNNSWSQTSTSGITPRKFNAPGMKTDVRVRVFEREFHVHSVVLKLYSAFFRTLLDSADKKSKDRDVERRFRYDYTSVLDPDGGWGLEAAKTVGES